MDIIDESNLKLHINFEEYEKMLADVSNPIEKQMRKLDDLAIQTVYENRILDMMIEMEEILNE